MPDITQGDEPSSLNQPVAEVGEKVEEKVEDIVIPDEMPF